MGAYYLLLCWFQTYLFYLHDEIAECWFRNYLSCLHDQIGECIAEYDQGDSTVVRVDNLTAEVPEHVAEPDQDDSTVARLDRLPVDILYTIAGFLPRDSEACLILSKKRFGLAIGYRSWLQLQSEYHTNARGRFLTSLGKDLKEWVACYQCKKLHSMTQDPSTYTTWRSLDEPPCALVDGAIELLPNFILRWRHAHMTMKLNKLSPKNNIWLDSLSHTNFRCQVPFAHCCARIANDSLIVKLEYRMWLSLHEGLREVERMLPEVCPHWTFVNENSSLEDLIRFLLSRGPDEPHIKSPTIQCQHCATEFFIAYLNSTPSPDGRALYITAWKNLGPCQTPYEALWQAQDERLYPFGSSSNMEFSFERDSIRRAWEDAERPNTRGEGLARMSPSDSDIDLDSDIDFSRRIGETSKRSTQSDNNAPIKQAGDCSWPPSCDCPIRNMSPVQW